MIKNIKSIILISIINLMVCAEENIIVQNEPSHYVAMLKDSPKQAPFHDIKELNSRSIESWNSMQLVNNRYRSNILGLSIFEFVELQDYLSASGNKTLENRAKRLYEIYPLMVSKQIKIEDALKDYRRDGFYDLTHDINEDVDYVVYCVDIYATYTVIDNRYNNSITPWNWTKDMKKAYEQISDVYSKIKDEKFFKELKKFIDQRSIIVGKFLIYYRNPNSKLDFHDFKVLFKLS